MIGIRFLSQDTARLAGPSLFTANAIFGSVSALSTFVYALAFITIEGLKSARVFQCEAGQLY